jgi:hypothetical protein
MRGTPETKYLTLPVSQRSAGAPRTRHHQTHGSFKEFEFRPDAATITPAKTDLQRCRASGLQCSKCRGAWRSRWFNRCPTTEHRCLAPNATWPGKAFSSDTELQGVQADVRVSSRASNKPQDTRSDGSAARSGGAGRGGPDQVSTTARSAATIHRMFLRPSTLRSLRPRPRSSRAQHPKRKRHGLDKASSGDAGMTAQARENDRPNSQAECALSSEHTLHPI